MQEESLHILVPQELFATAESSSYAGTLAIPELQAGPDTYRFANPLQWAVTLTNTGDAILVAGTVSGQGVTSCGRCLDDVDIDIQGDVEGYYLLHAPDADQDAEDEEDFEVLGEDNIIDLEPLLQAAVLVDVPLVPLCKPDCAGMCPDCGTNLNRETCICAEARAAANAAFEAEKNPFAKLRELDLGALDDSADGNAAETLRGNADSTTNASAE